MNVCVIMIKKPFVLYYLVLILCMNEVTYLTYFKRTPRRGYKLVSILLNERSYSLKVTIQIFFSLEISYVKSFSNCISLSKYAVFINCIIYCMLYVCIVSSQYKAQYYHKLIGDG